MLKIPFSRREIAAAVLHCYPLYSGCGTLANSALVRRFTPDSNDHVWAKGPGGYHVLAPLDDYVGRAVYYVGDLDRKVSWVCSRLVKSGDTVLDIGANIGLVTMHLSSLVGNLGKVHSFEPNPYLNTNIEQAIAYNRITNVRLHKIGLGEFDQELRLSVPVGNTGAASFVPDGSLAESLLIRVPVRPLTDVASEEKIEKIDFIKIDVEGYEPQVLRGGSDLLERCRPRAIIFELNQTGIPPQEHPTIQILRSMNYRFYTLPKQLLKMRAEAWDPDSPKPLTSHDLVASPAGQNYAQVGALLAAH